MPSPTFSRRKTVVFSLIAMALAWGAMEGAAHLLIARFSETGSFGGRALQNRFHPFLGWEHSPNAQLKTTKDSSGAETVIATDSFGNSATPATYAKPRLTIVITGGSTMFGVGSTSNATTTPSLLEKKIHDRLGIEAKVVNLAVRGYTSFQEALRLREYFTTRSADIVLAVSGRNDASAARRSPDLRYALLPQQVYLNAVPLVRDAENQKPIILNVLGLLRAHSDLLDLVARVALRVAGGTEFSYAKPPSGDDPAAIIGTQEQLAQGAAVNYRMMESVARGYGAGFALALQPTAYSWDAFPGDIPDLTGAPAEAARDKAQESAFYDLLRRNLAGAPVIDLATAFDGRKGKLYIDNCHYTDQGADLLSDALLRAAEPLIRQALAKAP